MQSTAGVSPVLCWLCPLAAEELKNQLLVVAAKYVGICAAVYSVFDFRNHPRTVIIRSPPLQRSYHRAIDEFIDWCSPEPRLGFNRSDLGSFSCVVAVYFPIQKHMTDKPRSRNLNSGRPRLSPRNEHV